MRVHQQPAFILHQRPYSETSLVLEVFTRAFGRLGLLAKGARRPTNRSRGALAPFQPLLIGWSGRGELPILTNAECDGVGPATAGRALYCGFYMNELLMRLLHRHDPHEVLYDRYRASVFDLKGDSDNEAMLRLFEKHLLREIGYGLLLERDINHRAPIRVDSVYDYRLDQGPIHVDTPEAAPMRGVKLHGATLLALANETFADAQCLREAKLLMRTILAQHLGDKPLHSRRLFSSGVTQENVRD